jgi:hypothetical protein
MILRLELKGGKGSGNFGHAGRAGKVGGSVSFDTKYPSMNNDYKSMQIYLRSNIVSLSQEESQAVIEYKGSSSNINNPLRKGEIGGDDYLVSRLDAAINSSTLKSNVSVYRGIDNAVLPDHSMVGSYITDLGFMSTSLSIRTAWGSADVHDTNYTAYIIRIGLKAGQHALNTEHFWDRGESELLLPRSARLKIVGEEYGFMIEGNEDSTYRMFTAEVI